MSLTVILLRKRGYQDLFFWDLLLQRIYLFIEDLLVVSVFARMLILALAPHARPHPHLALTRTLTELSSSGIM